MDAPAPEVALEAALIGNLARLNDWLRYAETKNAALLTFSSAWLVAICSIWSNDKAPEAIKLSMLAAAPLVAIAAITALVSLLPRRQKKAGGDTAQALTTSNLLFHGNIALLDIAAASNAFTARYKPADGKKVAPLHVKDLCTQTVETSLIATTKFKLFSRGVFCVLAAFIIAIFTLAISLAISS